MIRNSLVIYNRHLITVMILSVTLIIPVSLISYFSVFYLIQEFESYSYGSIYALFLIIINFTLMIPTFSKIAVNDLYDEEDSLFQLLFQFLKHFGVILFVSIPIFFFGIIGFTLLIPAIIALAMLIIFPFFVGFRKIQDIFKQTGKILINENIFLLVDFVIIICMHLFTWNLILLLIHSFENSLLVLGLAQSLINAVIYPLLIFYLTMRYRNTNLEGGVLLVKLK